MGDKIEYQLDKETAMRRMNCLNNAKDFVRLAFDAGVWKPKSEQEIIEHAREYYCKFLEEWIEQPCQQQHKQPLQPQIIKREEPEDAILPQKKTIWRLVYGDNGNINLEEYLKPLGLNRYNLTKTFINKKWASDFIDKHKKTEWSTDRLEN